jgi:hypothetical protein
MAFCINRVFPQPAKSAKGKKRVKPALVEIQGLILD